MKITRDDLNWAAGQGILSSEQSNKLWQALEKRSQTQSGFDIATVAYYFGALIVMSALGWFMTLGWQNFGGVGMFLIAACYALAFTLAGLALWSKDDLKIPGGLVVTLAVWMTPLAIYGLEAALGVWPQGNPGTFRDFHEWIRGSWFFMELGTIVAGLIALRFVRFAFLTFPIAFSLWYMSMDVTPLLLGQREFTWEQQLWVSLWFGLIILLISYLVDRRTKEDYAFWGYLFGLLAFWGGLSLMQSGSELNKFLYCMLNVGLMLVSVLLERKAFIVFGALGVFGYLGHLSYTVFKDSMMFPFALSFLGLLVIYLGVKYHKNSEAIESAVLSRMPNALQRFRPASR